MTPLAARAREIALRLTSWQSVTGTLEEGAFAERLTKLLGGFDRAWKAPVPGGDGARHNVFALKRGPAARTLVLTGHFDTVPYCDYGELAGLALLPEKLRPRMIESLAMSGENPLALADLKSGDFLPGRGLLDMKAGLAAGIAAMEAYGGDSTLLFAGVPDEENRSAGMRAAVPQLNAIAGEEGLDIALVVNLDSISDQGDGSSGRVVAFGSIGKLLLTAFVVGREAHACYPQDGVNAAYLAAELVTEFELAPDLAEQSGNESAAPSTALFLKDLKSGYNVTTPGQAFVYWNTLQHRRSAGEVLDIASSLARRAMARAAARVKGDILVVTYSDLAARVMMSDVAAIEAEIATNGNLDLPEQAKLITSRVWQRSGLTGPAIVLGFGSIPYPAVSLGEGRLKETISAVAKSFGLGTIRYFPGISDMSFLGERAGGLEVAAKNTPGWRTGLGVADAGSYPCINIGPWGRDYHHWLERLHAPYAFETLPRVLMAVIDAVAGRR